MNKGGKLLVSQIEIIKNIIGLISHSPCFIVLNGEIGAGKTTICEAVITYYQKRSKKSILGNFFQCCADQKRLDKRFFQQSFL